MQRAAHAKQRRRIVDARQLRPVAGFLRRQQVDAELLAGRKLAAGILLAAKSLRFAKPHRARSGSRASASRALRQ
jgi:hypothetical protein